MASADVMRKELSELASADLIFMLSEHGVPLETMHVLAKRGVKTVGRLAALEDKRDVFRKTIAELADINPEAGIEGNMIVTDLVQAWEAANHTVKAELETKASHNASGSDIPLPIPKRTYNAMEAAYKEQYGKLKDTAAPGLPLMALTLDMVENNAPHAEPLANVASEADGEDDLVFDVHDPKGAVRSVHRKIKKVAQPAGPEELRRRYAVLENAFLYAQLKHSANRWLAEFSRGDYAALAEYLLGDEVLNLDAAKETNTPVPWATVLKYEYQIRKKAMELIKDSGMGLRTSIRTAIADQELRNLHFINRITLGAGGRKRGAADDDTWKPKKWGKEPTGDWTGKGNWSKKGKTKGKGKGAGKPRGGKGKVDRGATWKGGFQIVAKTPDELPICFAFNWQGCDGSCGMIHCCRIAGCYDKHPMWQHGGWTGGAPQAKEKE